MSKFFPSKKKSELQTSHSFGLFQSSGEGESLKPAGLTTYPARLKRPPHRHCRCQHSEKASPSPTIPVRSSPLGNSRRWTGPTTRTSRAEGGRNNTSGSHSTGFWTPAAGLAWAPPAQKTETELNTVVGLLQTRRKLSFLRDFFFLCKNQVLILLEQKTAQVSKDRQEPWSYSEFWSWLHCLHLHNLRQIINYLQ